MLDEFKYAQNIRSSNVVECELRHIITVRWHPLLTHSVHISQ